MIKYLTKINKTENIKIKHSKYEQNCYIHIIQC